MLSVVITAYNEEKNLPRCVESVKKIASEIVLVDTESSDKTVSVAKKLGCKVFKHKNTGIVEPVRNFSISKAQGDWILLLDADEEVPESLASEISSVISNPASADYFRLPRKNLIFNKWIKSSHWWPDYVYRLFRKGAISWDDTIHSIPITIGRGADLPDKEDLALTHHHYSSISQFILRLDRYTDFGLQKLTSSGYKFSWTDIISKPSEEFLRQYFDRQGYKDGLHGLVLSLLQAFSELVLYSKAWQSQNFPEKVIDPPQVKNLFNKQVKDIDWWFREIDIRNANSLSQIWKKIIRRLQL